MRPISFALAVLAEQADDGAGGDGEVESVQNNARLVLLRELLKFEDRVSHEEPLRRGTGFQPVREIRAQCPGYKPAPLLRHHSSRSSNKGRSSLMICRGDIDNCLAVSATCLSSGCRTSCRALPLPDAD